LELRFAFYSEIEKHVKFIKQEIHNDLVDDFWKTNDFEFIELYMETLEELKLNIELLKEKMDRN